MRTRLCAKTPAPMAITASTVIHASVTYSSKRLPDLARGDPLSVLLQPSSGEYRPISTHAAQGYTPELITARLAATCRRNTRSSTIGGRI
jgi:hypothetical protein